MIAVSPSRACARLNNGQEAQLSQREHATLRVFEKFAQLLKVTQGILIGTCTHPAHGVISNYFE